MIARALSVVLFGVVPVLAFCIVTLCIFAVIVEAVRPFAEPSAELSDAEWRMLTTRGCITLAGCALFSASAHGGRQ